MFCLEIIVYIQYFLLSELFWEFLMLGIFINNSNNSFLESKSKYIFRDTGFTRNPPFTFWTNYLQTNFSNVFNNPYLFKSFPTNHLLYFMNFTQLNSTKDTPYFCIPKEFALFDFCLLGFSITGFVIKIVFTLILELIFITFIIYFLVKLYIYINVLFQNLANIFWDVLYILFRILSIFTFYFFVFLAIILFVCIFVNSLHVFMNFVDLFYILSSRSVSVNVKRRYN